MTRVVRVVLILMNVTLLGAGMTFLGVFQAQGQITNVTNDQATPIPGVPHDYIKLLAETVNPANGSLSIRIQIPMPPARQLNVPFSVDYDSNGTDAFQTALSNKGDA